ncbi:MAG: hypothetical protein ABI867_03750 [Kofleriaceae bacterium]
MTKYLHIGHRAVAPDDLYFSLHLVFARPLARGAQASVVAAMPPLLREQASKNGSVLSWRGPILCTWSMIRYYLAGETYAKQPNWEPFFDALDRWLAATAKAHPLWLVVQDAVDAETPLHRASAAAVLSRIEELAKLVKPIKKPDTLTFMFLQPLLRAALATERGPLAPGPRDACIALFALWGGGSESLADLVSRYPLAEQVELVRKMLRARHPMVMPLLAVDAALLMDDTVYADALATVSEVPVPYRGWLDSKTGLGSRLTSRDPRIRIWMGRLLDLIEAKGELAAAVVEEIETNPRLRLERKFGAELARVRTALVRKQR